MAAALLCSPPAASAAAGSLGDISGFTAEGDSYTFRSGAAALRVNFENDLLRVWLAPDGT
ncbi:hypothetical protein [Micromonospora sp. NPDC005173]|uniref:hypothetical protein n=1 Tax=Micromonospora sp. NPDC005173 TaxID=3157165 RepID=UPI0033B66DE3